MAQIENMKDSGNNMPENAEKSQIFADLSSEITEIGFKVFDRKTKKLSEYIVEIDNRKIVSVKLIQEVKILSEIDENLSNLIHKDLPFFDEKNNRNFSLEDYKIRKNPQKTIEEFYNMIKQFFVNNFDYICENAI